MTREPGYYWVKVDQSDAWSIGRFDGLDGDVGWLVPGDKTLYHDDDISEVGERIFRREGHWEIFEGARNAPYSYECRAVVQNIGPLDRYIESTDPANPFMVEIPAGVGTFDVVSECGKWSGTMEIIADGETRSITMMRLTSPKTPAQA